MKPTYRIVYLVIGLAALVPAGVKGLFWQRNPTVPVDPVMAQAGEVLFRHDWQPNDPLCAGGDGLGPVFNARSCVECHNQGGVGGGGDLQHNVTAFVVRSPSNKGAPTREGVVHSRGLGRLETLQDVHPDLPPKSCPKLEEVNALRQFNNGVHLSQRNTPALFGAKLIDEIPERVILANARAQQLRWGTSRGANSEEVPVGRPNRLANGRIGRFGWKAQVANLSDFVRAACANELGLSNPSQAQPVPIYPGVYAAPTQLDLTDRQCDEITSFCASLPRPVERLPQDVTPVQAARGKQLFHKIGCAECHTPKLGSVDGLYSDLLLHRMGQDLVGGGSYGEPPMPMPDRSDEGPKSDEWRTPPLWGVADSPPYLHDGRAATLQQAILMHGGQAKRAADRFEALRPDGQAQLIAFLRTLRAP
jgi:CxxC motif-containing protein (DUF1111 family)